MAWMGLRAAVAAHVAWTLLASAAAAGERILYVHDRPITGAHFVHAFALSDEGRMTELAGSPFSPPTPPSAGVVTVGPCATLASGKHGRSRFLFSTVPDGVTVWTIAADGGLGHVVGSPFDDGLGEQTWLGVTVVQRGSRRFVYSALFSAGLLAGFELEEDGTLTALPGSPFLVGDGPMGVDSAGDTLVCGNVGSDTLSMFKVERDGQLSEAPGSPFPVPGPLGLDPQLDAKGAFLAAPLRDDLFSSFVVDRKTKALTPAPGGPAVKPFAGDAGARLLGKKLVLTMDKLVDARGDPDVAIFTRAKDATLTRIGRQTLGFSSIAVSATDSRGELLVVASDDDSVPNIACWSVDPETGALLRVDRLQRTVTFVHDVEIVEM